MKVAVVGEHQLMDLVKYYAARAGEYDNVYLKPERQDEIKRLAAMLRNSLSGHRILEIACGTGFWTERIATAAKSITASDINDEVLAIAGKRLRGFANVSLRRGDAYCLEDVGSKHSAGLAAFWWSHVPKGRLAVFLDMFESRLEPCAVVVFTDNCYVKGNMHPITRTDNEGNTYQTRRLDGGAEHEVLKNFPSREEIRSCLEERGTNVEYEFLTYYWMASYRLNPR